MAATNAFSEDATGCCRRIKFASLKGALEDKEEWTCPVCGMVWKPRPIETIRYWEAQPMIEVFGGRSS